VETLVILAIVKFLVGAGFPRPSLGFSDEIAALNRPNPKVEIVPAKLHPYIGLGLS